MNRQTRARAEASATETDRLFADVRGVVFDAAGDPAPVDRQGDRDAPPALPYEGINGLGVVVEDLRCRGCGYDVRGLPIADMCPECGWSIARSASGAHLINSPRAHVVSLWFGTTLVVAAMLGSFIAALLGAIIAIALALSTSWADKSVLELLGNGFTVLGAGIALYGWWVFSTPDPALASSEQPLAARRVLRTLTALAFAMSLITLLLKAMEVGGLLPPGPAITFAQGSITFPLGTRTDIALGLVNLVSFLISLAQISAAMAYLATIAQRVPAPDLARRASRMVWLVWALQLVLGVGTLIAVIMQLVYLVRMHTALGHILARHDAIERTGSKPI